MYVPKPGDWGMSVIEGRVGFFVRVGQAIINDPSEWTHAFVVLEDGMVLEAMPRGARIVPIDEYSNKRVLFCSPPMTDEQRRAVVNVSLAMKDTPYSFLTYVYLALGRFGIKPAWILKKIKNRGRLICSQLVDFVYNASDVHLFNDGRNDGVVTPGDLARLAYEKGWDNLCDPGIK